MDVAIGDIVSLPNGNLGVLSAYEADGEGSHVGEVLLPLVDLELKQVVPPSEVEIVFESLEVSNRYFQISKKISSSKLSDERKIKLSYLVLVGSIHETTVEGIIAGAN